MKFKSTLMAKEIADIKGGQLKNPHALLGMHQVEVEGKERAVTRIFCPTAKKVTIIHLEDSKKSYPLECIDSEGLFEGFMGRRKNIFPYKVECISPEGHEWTYIDPYQFGPQFSEFDLYLFGEGTNYEIYKKLGAHFTTIDGIQGVYFAVWAPHAKRVSVIGEFNGWDGRRHQMRLLESNGIWEIFIPGIQDNETYKYEIKTQDDIVLYKADPYASFSELRPYTASKVYDLNTYKWKDAKWIKKRESKTYYTEPVSIYEMHVGSWKKHLDGKFYNYRELADDLVNYLKDMHYTHVELMGILEHPFDGSWGYQVTGYFSPTSRHGTPDDFRYFVETMHKNNIGVLLDWVPAHFPKDAFALEKFDGTALYEHSDPNQANHPQWGTLIFNYGRHEVALFLIASALSWFDNFHIDGLRVDAVASMIYLDYGRESDDYVHNRFGGRENLEAVEFVKQLNKVVHDKYPGAMMIAEESTAWAGVTHPVNEGGLGFGFKWNMGWMNDFLSYMKQDPIFRKHQHNKITFSLMYAFSENFIQALSHDEVVHGKSSMLYKMPGDEWQKFANLRVAYGYMYTHPGKKMLFMGNEFAQTREWSEARELDWELLQYDKHKQMQDFVRDLNQFYRGNKSLWEIDNSYDGFEWIDCDNREQSIISFIRKGKNKKDKLVIVVNFTPQVYENYRIGVEDLGGYEEVLNSDDPKYGGSGVVNNTIREAQVLAWNKKPYSITLRIPPLGISIFKVTPDKKSH